MIRVDSVEHDIDYCVLYELRDGTRISFDRKAVEEFGAAALIREMGLGHLLPTDRIPVQWHGGEIGSMDPEFDPSFTKSYSPFYVPRTGDFTKNGNNWIAANNLGPGDFEAIPGFAWKPGVRWR